jgi:hypothetical protein
MQNSEPQCYSAVCCSVVSGLVSREFVSDVTAPGHGCVCVGVVSCVG